MIDSDRLLAAANTVWSCIPRFHEVHEQGLPLSDYISPSNNQALEAWATLISSDPSFAHLKVALQIPPELRHLSQMIMAPPQHGKTTLIENMVADDLETGAAIVVMDSQTALLERLLRVVPRDRLVYLDAGDLEYPIAFSPFSITGARPGDEEPHTTRALDMFQNMFDAEGVALTEIQTILYRNLCLFLSVIPGSGFQTAIDILTNGYEAHQGYLRRLSPSNQQWIQQHLGATRPNDRDPYAATRKQVKIRFDRMMTDPILQRLFNSPVDKVNIGQAIRDRKVILISTASQRISDTGARVFGRYCLMQVANEVLARDPTNNPKDRVYFYIDEAQEYLTAGTGVRRLYEQGSKRGLCLVTAFHNLSQMGHLDPYLVDLLLEFNAIKIVNPSSPGDASRLAGEIRIDKDRLLAINRFHFGAHFRDRGYVTFKARPSVLDKVPALTPGDIRSIQDEMRGKYAYSTRDQQQTPAAPAIDPNAPQQPDKGRAYSQTPSGGDMIGDAWDDFTKNEQN